MYIHIIIRTTSTLHYRPTHKLLPIIAMTLKMKMRVTHSSNTQYNNTQARQTYVDETTQNLATQPVHKVAHTLCTNTADALLHRKYEGQYDYGFVCALTQPAWNFVVSPGLSATKCQPLVLLQRLNNTSTYHRICDNCSETHIQS